MNLASALRHQDIGKENTDGRVLLADFGKASIVGLKIIWELSVECQREIELLKNILICHS